MFANDHPQTKLGYDTNQNQITKIGKDVMNIVQFSIAFQDKVAFICIPKIMFILSA